MEGIDGVFGGGGGVTKIGKIFCPSQLYDLKMA